MYGTYFEMNVKMKWIMFHRSKEAKSNPGIRIYDVGIVDVTMIG
jgi:hypothetical protein